MSRNEMTVATQSMRTGWMVPVIVAAAGLTAFSQAPSVPLSAAATKTVVTFDAMESGKPPVGFSIDQTGPGSPCAWSVTDDPAAPSGGRVVAQTSTDETGGRFPLSVFDGWSAKDVSVSVRFRPVSGTVDRAAGLVARYRDKDNYYLVRANALEDNIRLYRVVAGKRIQFAGLDHKLIKEGEWHALRMDVQGKHFRVWFDGAFLYEADDDTFGDAGKVGLWTKADSVTYFDDLTFGEPGSKRSHDFESMTVGEVPNGLTAAPMGGGNRGAGGAASQPSRGAERAAGASGGGAAGGSSWSIAEDPTSPRGKKIVRMKKIENAPRNAGGALLDETAARDVSVSVFFKTLTGESEARVAGLVARYQDQNNCYSLRINTREDNIQLTRVVEGKRKLIGEIHHKLMAEGEWHTVQLEARGSHIGVFLDGQLAFEATDELLTGAGRAGIWGSPSSLTYFDGLSIEALDSN